MKSTDRLKIAGYFLENRKGDAKKVEEQMPDILTNTFYRR